MRLLGIAESGVRAQQLALDTISDNVANVNTPGYKSKRVDFAETLAVQQNGASNAGAGDSLATASSGVGSGTMYAGISPDLRQGMLTSTDNPLDLAIEGNGFFQVELPGGQIGYTRTGNFRQNLDGSLVNDHGYRLSPPLTVPKEAESVAVRPDGMVTGMVNGQERQFGQISLAQFPNVAGLSTGENGLLLPTDASGLAQVGTPGKENLGQIRGQTLEQSNVDLATALTDLVQVQRAYQLNSRLLQDGDKMWGIANSLRR